MALPTGSHLDGEQAIDAKADQEDDEGTLDRGAVAAGVYGGHPPNIPRCSEDRRPRLYVQFKTSSQRAAEPSDTSLKCHPRAIALIDIR